ncbi:hypothetical protein FACS189454_08240 [Planctomycetales bacterium]|nr:hypothetical protein FACS189454_08240 [Planctomycetales bacterium]
MTNLIISGLGGFLTGFITGVIIENKFSVVNTTEIKAAKAAAAIKAAVTKAVEKTKAEETKVSA